MQRALFLSSTLALCLAGTASAPAADLAPLVRATQLEARDPHAMTVVWWLPPAFIEATLQQSNFSAAVRRQTLASLQDYTLVALLHVSRDKSGTLNLATREEVLSHTVLAVQGRTLAPLAPEQIRAATHQLLDGMQTGLTRSMGLQGEAPHLVAYPAVADGRPLFDPRVTAAFTVHSYGHDFVFSTRLADAHSWKYTPVVVAGLLGYLLIVVSIRARAVARRPISGFPA